MDVAAPAPIIALHATDESSAPEIHQMASLDKEVLFQPSIAERTRQSRRSDLKASMDLIATTRLEEKKSVRRPRKRVKMNRTLGLTVNAANEIPMRETTLLMSTKNDNGAAQLTTESVQKEPSFKNNSTPTLIAKVHVVGSLPQRDSESFMTSHDAQVSPLSSEETAPLRKSEGTDQDIRPCVLLATESNMEATKAPASAWNEPATALRGYVVIPKAGIEQSSKRRSCTDLDLDRDRKRARLTQPRRRSQYRLITPASFSAQPERPRRVSRDLWQVDESVLLSPASVSQLEPALDANATSNDSRHNSDASSLLSQSPSDLIGPPRFYLPSPLSSPPPFASLDHQFVENVKAALSIQKTWKTSTIAKRQARRIHELLSISRPPDSTEALFLTSSQAAECLRPNIFFPGVIITQNQQRHPLQTVSDFFREHYDPTAKVWIQDSSQRLTKTSPTRPREVTLSQLQQHFSSEPKMPWNCLELATHIDDGLRPSFLNNEDCRLLTKLKLPSSADKAGRHGYSPGWKEVEKWALLARAGALTEPHQDSHGYSTWITVNQGTIGFGWLANPTPSQRQAWLADPQGYSDGGPWRHVVLREGQTIYFPAGTVHFVFRLKAAGDTFAFGGHVLRCSQVLHWARTLLEELKAGGVANEDLTVSAPAYLERVERFVRVGLEKGEVELERWGGRTQVEEFLRCKEKFFDLERSLLAGRKRKR